MQVIGLHGPARGGKNTVADYLAETYGFVRFAFSDALYAEVAAAYQLLDETLLRDAAFKEKELMRMNLEHCIDPVFREIARYKILKESHGLAFPKHTPRSPRWVLQVWGTEYRRAQDENYWVKKADTFLEAFVETLKRTVTQEEYDAGVKERAELIAGDRGVSAVDGDEIYQEAARMTYPVGTEYYDDHPGIVVDGVRFQNEYDWIKKANGSIWHIRRPEVAKIGGVEGHASETEFPLRTGDKLILNYSTIPLLYTGISLAMQGNDIVNTGE